MVRARACVTCTRSLCRATLSTSEQRAAHFIKREREDEGRGAARRGLLTGVERRSPINHGAHCCSPFQRRSLFFSASGVRAQACVFIPFSMMINDNNRASPRKKFSGCPFVAATCDLFHPMPLAASSIHSPSLARSLSARVAIKQGDARTWLASR